VITKPKQRSQAQRRDESQTRILEAALDLLIEKGFDRFSLSDVGKRAQCSHELANFYFESKDGLLKALAKHIIRNISDELLMIEVDGNGFERLAKRILYTAEISERDDRGFTAYLRIAGEAPFSEHLAELYRDRRRQTIDIFKQSITAGIASGDIRRSTDRDLVAQVCYDFVRGHVDRRLLDRNGGDAKEMTGIVHAFIDMLRGQIAVRKRYTEVALRDFTDPTQTTDRSHISAT
jgi:AcrR family transcriptional regulator